MYKSLLTDRTDSDSMASKREAVAKAERAFKLFDKNNDGYITKEEFQKISKKLDKQQVSRFFAMIGALLLLEIIRYTQFRLNSCSVTF